MQKPDRRYRFGIKPPQARSLRTYAMSLAGYGAMLEEQGGVCAICKGVTSSARGLRLFVDHDHVTGEVSALLCHTCNVLIGCAKEDTRILEAAIEYVNAAHLRRAERGGDVPSEVGDSALDIFRRDAADQGLSLRAYCKKYGIRMRFEELDTAANEVMSLEAADGKAGPLAERSFHCRACLTGASMLQHTCE